ncbi:hypothetical protein DUI87_26461 [Hirundo rustica rustica]|uniref:Uncharacterized protein n=1 Tax=Hirundo rustica rustica TaxID=333673 RepID=A0A3M0J7W3_HIRRU|nr:hypothetical protein DUI87_26461 [Hirundo rustica rustica]
MRDLLWGITKVTPGSRLGQEVEKFIGYCCEVGSVQQVQASGTELPLHCSKPVYRGVVTQENEPADDWQASTSRGPELQWGSQVLMTIVREMRGTSDRPLHQVGGAQWPFSLMTLGVALDASLGASPRHGTLELPPAVVSQRGDLEETPRLSWAGGSRIMECRPLHRQAKSGSLDIPGSSVQRSVLELQQPQSCEHCSGSRALGKGPGPGLGLGQWPREQINLQLLPQSREEQELLAGRDSCQGPAAPGHRPWLDTAWGQGELGCGDGLVPWEGGGVLTQSGRKSCGCCGIAGSVRGVVAGDLVA